jgi:thymidylate synthase (FAD)
VTVEAKLIAVTQPVVGVPASNAEDLVAFCARVSSSREYDDRGKDYKGLLKYCIKNKHWSIFEMSNAVVEVKAPRDISRQLLRHRSFSFQEFSQRYSDDIEFCDREYRLQDKTNRQNSIEGFTKEEQEHLQGFSDRSTESASTFYESLTETWGVAKECARVVLPEGLTMSTLYVNGTLRSWLHYLEVRDDIGVTQKEHVMLAREIRKALEPVFPTVLGMANE